MNWSNFVPILASVFFNLISSAASIDSSLCPLFQFLKNSHFPAVISKNKQKRFETNFFIENMITQTRLQKCLSQLTVLFGRFGWKNNLLTATNQSVSQLWSCDALSSCLERFSPAKTSAFSKTANSNQSAQNILQLTRHTSANNGNLCLPTFYTSASNPH